ncbi:TPA: hypothetical protein HA238_04285 [Candidatus Micrarchaeota archaeon]|nr:hypothetical protein [Candidatus Micrarchaeota archaeon]
MTFRQRAADAFGRVEWRGMNPFRVIATTGLLVDDTLHSGVEKAAKCIGKEDICERGGAINACIITGTCTGTLINPRDAVIYAALGFFAWIITKIHTHKLSEIGYNTGEPTIKEKLEGLTGQAMVIRLYTLYETISSTISGFLKEGSQFANAVIFAHITIAFYMSSPSNGIIERVKNFINPSRDNTTGNGKPGTGN